MWNRPKSLFQAPAGHLFSTFSLSIRSSCVNRKILLANCSQTDTASNVRSSWKNDTVLYSTRYHPSKPSVRHIPLCTASCVMKSDNTLPRFKSLWLWGDGEAQQEKYVNDVLCVSPWFSTDSISYSAQNSNNCSLTLSSLKC